MEFMMSIGCRWVIALMMAVTAGTVLAQESGEAPLLDVQRAILNTDDAQRQVEALREEEDFKSNQEELESLLEELKETEEYLNKEGALLSQEDREEQQRKLVRLRGDAEHVNNKLQQAQQELLDRILRKKVPQLNALLTEMIDEDDIGMYMHSSFDITDKATERLNRQP